MNTSNGSKEKAKNKATGINYDSSYKQKLGIRKQCLDLTGKISQSARTDVE